MQAWTHPFYVFGLEMLFGAKEQDAQVVGVDTKFTANFVTVALIEKDGLQESAIAGGHIGENFADFVLQLTSRDDVMGAGTGRGQLRLVLGVEGLAAVRRAVVLEENVVADGIDESAEAFGLAQSAFLAEGGEDAGKGLLAHVFDGLPGLKPRAKLEVEQLSEVPDEVLLSAKVSSAQTFDVSRIECMKLQRRPRKSERPQV